MTESVETVLKYLRDAAGFAIAIKPSVPMGDLERRPAGRPENEEQALALLKQATAGMGCTVLRKGRILTILTAQEAKKHYVPLPLIQRG